MGILAGLISTLVSAPVAAAGAGAKGLGDAVQLGADGIPTLKVAGSMLSSAGESAMGGASAIRDGLNDFGSLMPDVNFAAFGRGISGFTSSLTPGNQELSQSLVRAPAIAAVSNSAVLNYFDPADLFTAAVSAPTFNSIPLEARGAAQSVLV